MNMSEDKQESALETISTARAVDWYRDQLTKSLAVAFEGQPNTESTRTLVEQRILEYGQRLGRSAALEMRFESDDQPFDHGQLVGTTPTYIVKVQFDDGESDSIYCKKRWKAEYLAKCLRAGNKMCRGPYQNIKSGATNAYIQEAYIITMTVNAERPIERINIEGTITRE